MTTETGLGILLILVAISHAFPVWRWIVWKKRALILRELKAEEFAHAVHGQMMAMLQPQAKFHVGMWNNKTQDDEFPRGD